MRRDTVNAGTFAGRVRNMSVLQQDPLGHPLLHFYLDCRTHIDAISASPFDLSEKHHCAASGEIAERLSSTVTDGATLLVEGPLYVNSRAGKPLYRRIACIPVQSATLLRPARTAHEIAHQAAGKPDLARNDVRLVGKIIGVDFGDEAPRLTIATRLPFPATHDVLVWSSLLDDRRVVPIGAIAEVNGVLIQHVTVWPDGQVRMLSKVESDDVTIFDVPKRAVRRSLALSPVNLTPFALD